MSSSSLRGSPGARAQLLGDADGLHADPALLSVGHQAVAGESVEERGDGDAVAGVDERARGDAVSVDEGAVGAGQVLEPPLPGLLREPRMLARDQRRIDRERAALLPADDERAGVRRGGTGLGAGLRARSRARPGRRTGARGARLSAGIGSDVEDLGGRGGGRMRRRARAAQLDLVHGAADGHPVAIVDVRAIGDRPAVDHDRHVAAGRYVELLVLGDQAQLPAACRSGIGHDDAVATEDIGTGIGQPAAYGVRARTAQFDVDWVHENRRR